MESDEPIESSHYAATAVNHLREQHKKEGGRFLSYDDVALTFGATQQPGVKKLMTALCNKNTYERKVPEGADTSLVLSIVNLHRPENGVIILPDKKERPLTDFTGDAAEFTQMDQLVALGQEITAHQATHKFETVKPVKSVARRNR